MQCVTLHQWEWMSYTRCWSKPATIFPGVPGLPSSPALPWNTAAKMKSRHDQKQRQTNEWMKLMNKDRMKRLSVGVCLLTGVPGVPGGPTGPGGPCSPLSPAKPWNQHITVKYLISLNSKMPSDPELIYNQSYFHCVVGMLVHSVR